MDDKLKLKIQKAILKSDLSIPEISDKSQKYKSGNFRPKSLYRWLSGERSVNITALRTLEKILKVNKGAFTALVLK